MDVLFQNGWVVKSKSKGVDMAGHRAHLVVGSIAYFVGLSLVWREVSSVEQPLCWYGASILGALFPDVQTKSLGQKLFYLLGVASLGWFLVHGQFWPFVAIASILALPSFLRKEGGLLHDPFFVVLAPIMIAWGLASMSLSGFSGFAHNVFFFAAGTTAHLLLDGCLIPKKIIARFRCRS